MRFALLIALFALAGCATTSSPATCDARKAASLIGSIASAELGGQALGLTGARSLRWIQPGTMVTMDYRIDRLNIRLDAANRITKFDCG